MQKLDAPSSGYPGHLPLDEPYSKVLLRLDAPALWMDLGLLLDELESTFRLALPDHLKALLVSLSPITLHCLPSPIELTNRCRLSVPRYM